jgi:hypothetical protein
MRSGLEDERVVAREDMALDKGYIRRDGYRQGRCDNGGKSCIISAIF